MKKPKRHRNDWDVITVTHDGDIVWRRYGDRKIVTARPGESPASGAGAAVASGQEEKEEGEMKCAWVLFALLVGGIIFYGFAKIVLLVILVGAGLFIGSATACGIWETITKRRPAKTTSVIEQSRALAGRAAVHQDDEIAQLRRMAGLDT